MLKLNKKTICLNMIVKNESAIIERCLNSLVNQIDYWVIVDTGYRIYRQYTNDYQEFYDET